MSQEFDTNPSAAYRPLLDNQQTAILGRLGCAGGRELGCNIVVDDEGRVGLMGVTTEISDVGDSSDVLWLPDVIGLKPQEPEPRILEVWGGEMQIDCDTRDVQTVRETSHLTEREFKLLVFMAKNPNRVLSFYELIENCWGTDYTLVAPTGSLRAHVVRIRKKIGEDVEGRIQTIRNVGYMFVDNAVTSE